MCPNPSTNDSSINSALRKRWIAFGGVPDVFEELRSRYSEPHRHYHTFEHIRECLQELDAVGGSREIELALWFHDFVYDPKAKDNEERSAERAVQVARDLKLSEEQVREFILATHHSAPPAGEEARLVVDIDLSILGADPNRFDEYERQIREEYSWVPEPTFHGERARILISFLDRPSIYGTERFRKKLEKRARANLERSLILHR